jgi:hypothetical protein
MATFQPIHLSEAERAELQGVARHGRLAARM